MERFVIVSIEDNHLNPEGHALIVKANRVENASGLEYLFKRFGKKYYTYAKAETPETEIFVFPYSEKLLDELLGIIRPERVDEEDCLWEPDMNLFYDSRLQLRNGVVKTIHKSIDFKKEYSSGRQTKNSVAFIPPVAEWQFKHKEVQGYKCIVYSALQADIEEKSDGGFLWGSGDMTFFIFPDNDYYNKMLRNTILLDPRKREFWIPDLNDFYGCKIYLQNSLARTTHSLYISNDLPAGILIKNLAQLLN